ncbi:LCP family protein [Cellulosilyticum sp. I15G10I2]|uniref:LCP family protein n=1 Tax=Cellulosilyticum sp. I15G10I2 TaxID=1892843 RepID=UPI00085C75AC|nr:LCP family protein [Cellulosilyticum sp. I15G10I2]
MKRMNKELNMVQQKKLLKIFLKAIAITMVVCTVIIGIGIGAYYSFIYDNKVIDSNESLTAEEQELENQKQAASVINQTIAVFGVDEDGIRTDVIFVVNFNSKTNKVKLVSIPRDTKVQWTETQRSKLKEYKGTNIYTSKINEMTAYGGIENIRDFTINQIENMLGIKIDNHIIINLEAFRKIVDTIGGVEVDVPRRMRYTDNAQGLYINLDAGLQLLDGKKAEQLVRFRQYLNGDVDRIQVQQLFLKAFAQKVMSPQMITKIPQIIPILFTYIKTDVNLTQIASYYPFLQSFNLNYLSFNTIPGEGRYENGISYFFPDRAAMDALIEDVFFDTEAAPSEADDNNGETSTQNEPVIDKTVTIEVLNATGVTGIAGKIKDTLEKQGYKVGRIDNYSKSDLESTVIYAKDIQQAEQFKTYFKGASIQTNTTIGYDIQIIVGKGYIN